MSKEKEQLLLRALNTTDTALQPEDLSRLMTLVTPTDVHVMPRLARATAKGLTHEWVEATLAGTGTFVSGVYADGGIPVDVENTHARKSNKLMSIGRVAKATGLMGALDVITNSNGQQYADAFALELAEKMADFMRVMEYYIINGDATNTSPQEMNGILKTITTNSVTCLSGSANTAITEAKLRDALKKCYDAGGNPNAIYCRPGVAMTIAAFSDQKISYTINANEAPRTVAGGAVFKYLSPFGQIVDIVPVRADFLPSGKVVLLQESDVRICFASNGIELMDIPISSDSQAKLIKAYLTLEHRSEVHSCIISGVADA